MIYYAIQDIKSNFRFIYAKRGSKLEVITESIDVFIVQDEAGKRFSCHKDKLSVIQPEPEKVIEPIKPIDLFNQL